MIESCNATAKDVSIMVYLNDDDDKISLYKNIRASVITGPRRSLAEAYNYIFEQYPDYDYYSLLNDDHVCITPGWDAKLINMVEEIGHGWGIACAEDKLTNWSVYQHPSGCVVSGNIPRTLGYFIWPEIKHIGIDCYFMYLMKGINRLFHTTDVVIEHRHWLNHKALLDANYKWVYSHEQFSYGMQKVSEYMSKQYFIDLYKLNMAMGGGDLHAKI
jgi:hypothetical protein